MLKEIFKLASRIILILIKAIFVIFLLFISVIFISNLIILHKEDRCYFDYDYEKIVFEDNISLRVKIESNKGFNDMNLKIIFLHKDEDKIKKLDPSEKNILYSYEILDWYTREKLYGQSNISYYEKSEFKNIKLRNIKYRIAIRYCVEYDCLKEKHYDILLFPRIEKDRISLWDIWMGV